MNKEVCRGETRRTGLVGGGVRLIDESEADDSDEIDARDNNTWVLYNCW